MIWQMAQVALATVLGGAAMWVTSYLWHVPFRPVHRWEDELLRREVAEAEAHAADNPSARAYAVGLRNAAIMLGADEPIYRQDRALRRRTTA